MAIPIEIDVWQGEIAELEVDAILVPANESLFMTTPVGRGGG
jgi:O-acetyl-ADP-ribose deacetylase (regulator of RNase III)